MRLLYGRLRGERGFSFIELLIVVILLGILAAIVLPAFLSQTGQGDDASAKSDAREVATAVEHCFAEGNDYTQCDERAELQVSGLPWGTAEGQVQVISATSREYVVRAISRNGHRFTWTKAPNGAVARSCSPSGEGGCDSTGAW